MSQPEFDEEQVKFQDVAVCFSEEEWKVLQEWQKDFYKNVMKEIHQTVIAMGYQIVNTGTLLRIHKGKDIYIQDLQDTVTADTCNQTALSHPTVNPDVLFRIAQTEDPYCRDEQCPREKEVSNSPGSCFPIVTSAYSLTTDEELELCSTDHQGSKQRSSHHAAAHGTCEANEYGSSRTQAWSQGSKSSSILHITRGLSRQLDEQNERTTSHNERTSQGYPFCQTEVCLSDEDEPPLRLRGHPDEDVESSSSDSSSGPLAIPDDDIVKIKEEEEEDIYFVDHKDSEIMERISNLPDGGSKRRQRKFAESVQSIKTNAPSRESLWEKTTKVLHASYMGLNSRRQMRSESYQEMKRDKNLKYESSFRLSDHFNLPTRRPQVALSQKFDECDSNLWNSPYCNGLPKPQQNPARYTCAECGVTFRLKRDLIRHKESHSGLRPYACTDCGKSFFRKPNLTKHYKTHTGQKPYKCTFCHKRFSRKDHLNRHTRIHTGERPYKCNECERSFPWISDLNQHRRTRH
ncbi:zinc finger protein 12-like isoform X2 [Pleurodeles waltl]|uniref:zinc finger protein 12-like isoform X2 n=1 Tax=Pleurodeles waltl TaxID=8319 RepID=UPI0037097D9A